MYGPICSLCKEQGHHLMNCTELTVPLRPGFHSGGDGGGGHGGDDDEHVSYMRPRSERLSNFETTVSFLDTTVLFVDASSATVRSENSSTVVIHDVVAPMVLRFVL